jgi:hypothetical protein
MALVNEQATDNNLDYLVQEKDKAVLKNLGEMAEHLKNLKIKLLEAEARYDDAKKEYEYYASSVLPMEMYNAGMESVTLTSGGTVSVSRKFRCTPNKNANDRQVQVEWLRKHGLDKLIKESAMVEASHIEKLKAAGLPYVEVDDFNTNSLKAHLCDLLGIKGGVAQIQVTDIPESFHFQEVTECTIDI